jgi:hypothetical protein
MLNKYIIACLTGLFLCVSNVKGQVFSPFTEAGGFLGVSYYLGDINPRKHFHDRGLAFGGLVKHNFTEHHCMRFNMFFAQLKGNDLYFENEYQQRRAHSFETSLLDCHIGYEFNFMPYVLKRRLNAHTSYIFAGVGYSLIVSSTTNMATGHATIPFGVGYKYRMSERVSIGCEWGMRKSFTDTVDGLLNPGPEGSYSSVHNNDWYSFAGVFMTIRIFEKRHDCPWYKEIRTYN